MCVSDRSRSLLRTFAACAPTPCIRRSRTTASRSRDRSDRAQTSCRIRTRTRSRAASTRARDVCAIATSAACARIDPNTSQGSRACHADRRRRATRPEVAACRAIVGVRALRRRRRRAARAARARTGGRAIAQSSRVHQRGAVASGRTIGDRASCTSTSASCTKRASRLRTRSVMSERNAIECTTW
jgi:hypothetical protein